MRATSDVVLEPEGLLLFLNYTPCPMCKAAERAVDRAATATSPLGDLLPDAPRRTSVIPGPNFRIIRHGPNRFELRAVRSPDVRQYYVRAPTMRLD